MQIGNQKLQERYSLQSLLVLSLTPCFVSFLPLRKSHSVFVTVLKICKFAFVLSIEKIEVSSMNSHNFQLPHFVSCTEHFKLEEEPYHLQPPCALNPIPFCPLSELIHQYAISPYSGPDQLLQKYAIDSKLIFQLPSFPLPVYFSAVHQNYLSKKMFLSPELFSAQHFMQDPSQSVNTLLAVFPTLSYHLLAIMAIPLHRGMKQQNINRRLHSLYHFKGKHCIISLESPVLIILRQIIDNQQILIK